MIRAWVVYISAGVPPTAWWWQSAAGGGKASKKKAGANDGEACLESIASGIAFVDKLSMEESDLKARAWFVHLAEFLIGCL